MQIPGLAVGKQLFVLTMLGASVVWGQDYPNKPIRVVTTGVGGAGDITARLIAQGITGSLGQPLIVENRPNVQGETVAKSAPDGYTLLVSGGNLWLTPLLQKMPYDPVRDFAPISMTDRDALILVVHPSLR